MEDRMLAMEGFLDKIRKSKLESADFVHQKNYKTFSSVKEYVNHVYSTGDRYGLIRGIRCEINDRRTDNAEATDDMIRESITIMTNGLANMFKLHKAICMGIVTEYNSGGDKPWAWEEEPPYEKLELKHIEHEIQAEGCYLTYYQNKTTLECAFTDGPHNIYGGHSLVVNDYVPSKTFDANGKYIGDPKKINYSIEG